MSEPEEDLAAPAAHPQAPYDRVKRAVEARVKALIARDIDRLPAEEELSRQLGASRATLRSALLALQLEGRVSRRHGIGTLINRHAWAIEANLVEDLPFLEVIERSGGTPAIEIARILREPLTTTAAGRLGLPPGEPAIVIDRLFRSSGRPVVLSRDRIPERLVTATQPLDAGPSVFAFLRDHAGRTVRYSVAHLGAVAASDEVTTLLEVAIGAPLLVLDHLHIDERDEPVALTEALVRSDRLGFAVVRTGSVL